MISVTVRNQDTEDGSVELVIDLKNHAISLSVVFSLESTFPPIVAHFDLGVCEEIVRSLNDCITAACAGGHKQITFRDALTQESSWFAIASHAQGEATLLISLSYWTRHTDYEMLLDKNDCMRLIEGLSTVGSAGPPGE